MLVRLRPIVHVTPTDTGLHVRGRASSFTVNGGKGLWTVWQRLSRHLVDGIPAGELAVPDGAPAPVAKALEIILTQLREHDMIVEVPAGWGTGTPAPAIATWLESVAADPQESWRRLRESTITITGSGALAAAARRAVSSAGLCASDAAGDGLLATSGDHAVAAGCAAGVGWVVPPGARDDVLTDARAVGERLGAGDGPPPEVLAALVASAAVHRLICAVGGLPDPSTEHVLGQPERVPVDPAREVLVARLDPLRAAYHSWLSNARPAGPPRDASHAMDILTDSELGPVPALELGALPQIPANLARCGAALGIGTTVDAARLDVTLAAVRARLPSGAAVGFGSVQALGSALRQAVRHLPGADPVPEREWATDPTARRWWKALTLRFAVPATLDVLRLAAGVVRAEIHSPQGLLAWAVEASAADAVAFAALAATGHAQAGESGTIGHLNAATPLSTPDDQPPWVTREWHWPAGLIEGEPAFQSDLAALAGPLRQLPLDPALEAAGLVAYAVEPR